MPDLKRASDVWRLLEGPTVYVPPQSKKNGPVVMLDWDCTWDEEQGLRVMIKKGMVARVMGQGDGW